MTEHLICGLVSENPDAPIRGSVIVPCTRCGRGVWVAPSGQEILGDTNAIILCIPCGMKAIEADPDPVINPLLESQRSELREHLGRRG